ncbi:hypothetical protein ACS0TY_023063 [Phlomoides rotata]
MAAAAGAAVYRVVALLFLLYGGATFSAAATWCVTRSDASDQALQTALDYACGAGADCAPIQPSGLCFLPNTVQAHASYAFNSYYQRKGNAPDSCSFGGTSTIAKTDPSYGSCVYPSSPSTAGGAVQSGGMPGGTTTAPGTIVSSPPPPGTMGPLFSGGGAGTGPEIPDAPTPSGSQILLPMIYLLIFVIIIQTMLI